MLATLALSLSLALSATSAASPSQDSRTLWLVQPLHPGQDLIVQRAEQAIATLLPEQERSRQLIGRPALIAWLQGRHGSTGCLFGDEPCREPLEAWLSSLGLETIVLVRGGQDESGFHFQAIRLRPATGERTVGEATHSTLERALTLTLEKVLERPILLPVEETSQVGAAPQHQPKRTLEEVPAEEFIYGRPNTLELHIGQHLPDELFSSLGSALTLYPGREGQQGRGFASSQSVRLMGIGLDYSRRDRHFGMLLAGFGYYESPGSKGLLVEGQDAQGQLTRFNYKVRMFNLRVFQPQVRLAHGRFTVSLQAGLEAQLVLLGDRSGNPVLEAGMDLRAVAQAGVSFFIAEGMFVSCAFQYGRSLLSGFDHPAYGLRGGLGYAF